MLRFVLLAVGVLALFAGFVILAAAKSAIHEIEAFILFLVASVLVSGFAVVDAIKSAVKRLLKPG